jgi:hypothetical protein
VGLGPGQLIISYVKTEDVLENGNEESGCPNQVLIYGKYFDNPHYWFGLYWQIPCP